MTRSKVLIVGFSSVLLAVLAGVLLVRNSDRGIERGAASSATAPERARGVSVPETAPPPAKREDDANLLESVMPPPPGERELRRIEWQVMKKRVAEEKRLAVQRETLEESVDDLMFAESFEDIDIDAIDWMGDPRGASDAVRKDIRMQKLLHEKEKRSVEEIGRIRDAIMRGSEKYLHDLPMSNDEDQTNVIGQAIMSSPGVAVAAIVLAELDGDGKSLPRIVEMHEHHQNAAQEMLRRKGPESVEDYIYTFDGAMFAEAEDIVLSRMLARLATQQRSDPDIPIALADYRSAKNSETFESGDPSDGMICHKQEVLLGIAQRIVGTKR